MKRVHSSFTESPDFLLKMVPNPYEYKLCQYILSWQWRFEQGNPKLMSVRYLAEELGWSQNTILKSLRGLIEKGLIEKITPDGQQTATYRSTITRGERGRFYDIGASQYEAGASRDEAGGASRDEAVSASRDEAVGGFSASRDEAILKNSFLREGKKEERTRKCASSVVGPLEIFEGDELRKRLAKVTHDSQKDWIQSFGEEVVKRRLRDAVMWVLADPAREKKNYATFFGNWLKREEYPSYKKKQEAEPSPKEQEYLGEEWMKFHQTWWTDKMTTNQQRENWIKESPEELAAWNNWREKNGKVRIDLFSRVRPPTETTIR